MKKRYLLEIVLSVVFVAVVYFLSSYYDFFEAMVEWIADHEEYELDEVFMALLFLVFLYPLFILRRIIQLKKINNRIDKKNRDLNRLLSEVKELKALLPICSSCKKIRDDEGYWHQVEHYIEDRLETQFSHSLCPDCAARLYPGLFNKEDKILPDE